MAFKTIHLAQSIPGALHNWRAADWKRACKWITRNDGSRFTPDSLKAEFIDILGNGIKCIPIGECNNFDPVTGCKGHPESETAPAAQPFTA